MPDERTPVRIAIADDHPIFRDGLKRLLESEPHFKVVGEASDGIDAVRIVREQRPDVLLLDVAMPRMGGMETLAALQNVVPAPRVLLLTASVEARDIMSALQLGAKGVVLKESATQLLIRGIHDVMDGKFLVGGNVTDDVMQAVRHVGVPVSRRYGLTARELEVVAAVVAGDSNKEIAERLNISQQTVKHHLTNVFDKTGASSRLELAMLAVRQGLVASDQ